MEKPFIGISMGDPAGIGPEIVLKALLNRDLYSICKPVVIGNIKVLQRVHSYLQPGLELNLVSRPDQGKYTCGFVDVISVGEIDAQGIMFGKVQHKAGQAAFLYIKKAVELANLGEIDAIATAPINKEAIKAAKINFIGHTEMLADMTGTEDPLTMFQVFNLRIFFLSRHVSLKMACDIVKKDRLVHYIRRCEAALKMLGLDSRRIAVAGLNPHSGERGLFGDEETREIGPAIKISRESGIDVTGPVPADSVFHQALKGRYDAVLSLYHDQGHIASKMVDFEKTISLTIGLPFLRTSVDHGTAYDIAGSGIAGSVSMEEAIRMAADYVPKYKKKGNFQP